MSPTDKTTEGRGVKTLAIRLDDELHARLSVIAQLQGNSLTDEIRQAIEAHIERVAASPELSSMAETVLADIDRDASNRRAAIASLFGTTEATAKGRSPKS